MNRNNIKESLDKLNSQDIYSLLLFVLFNLKGTAQYSLLSELVFILDKESLLNLLTYYEGQTITIPKKEELQVVINSLLVYQKINIEHKTLQDALTELNLEESEEILTAYKTVLEVMSKYETRL